MVGSYDFNINVIDDKNVFEQKKEMFALVNTAEIFDDTNFEYHEVKEKIKSINNYISMKDILDTQSDGQKQVYKLSR